MGNWNSEVAENGAKRAFVKALNKLAVLVQTAFFGIFVPILAGLAVSVYLFSKYQSNMSGLKQTFVLEQRSESRQNANKIQDTLTQVHSGLRTLAMTPGIRNLESGQADEDTWSRISEVLSSLSTRFNVEAIQVSFAKSGKQFRFDQSTIQSKPADFLAEPTRNHLKEDQVFNWFSEKFPVIGYATLVDYPSTLRQFQDKNWSYELPLFGAKGEIIGLLSARVAASEIKSLIPNGDIAMVDPNTESVISLEVPGSVATNIEIAKKGEKVDNQIYSEVIPLDFPDKRSNWRFWTLKYDQVFNGLSEVEAERNSIQMAILATWVVVCGVIFGIKAQRRRQEQKFQSMVRNSQEIILVVDNSGQIEHVIGQLKQQVGWKPEEFLGLKLQLFLDEPSKEILEAMFSNVLQHLDDTQNGEIRVESVEGIYVWYEATATNMLTVPGIGGVLLTLRNIEARKHSEATIIAAKEAAERANEAKSEFLSRMSHELRTPLNAILGFGQLLEMSDLKPREQENVEQIMKGGRHLLNLVNDILDIARIETRKISLSMETVECDGVIAEAVTLISPLASRQNIPIHVDCPLDLHVSADNQRLKQVLLNLLSNAVKYNKPDGEVFVSAQKQSGSVLLVVRDTGNGIDSSSIRRLFTPFDRLGADRSSVEGSGLGLALSKTMIEAMGGQIEVTSSLGVGTTFTLVLPYAEADGLQLKETKKPRTKHAFQNKKLLYIEDNLANLKLVKDILDLHPQFELLTAVQGGMGIEMAELHQPDLIILDLDLPDINGIDVLTALRENPITKESTIVIMSAEASENKINKVFELGADDFLAKPINIRKFMEMLEPNQTQKAA